MLLKAPEPFSFNDRLRNDALAAARRIAEGTVCVRRDANPRRSEAITFEHLGKLSPIGQRHLVDLATCFAELLPTAQTSKRIVILGLAESGIVPAFAMQQGALAQGVTAQWCFSSRTDRGGLAFSEPHSHAPRHFLPPGFDRWGMDELWIVEDEVTTGQTLSNLRRVLMDSRTTLSIRFFSILDARVTLPTDSIPVESILRGVPSPGLLSTARISHESAHLSVGEGIAEDLPALWNRSLASLRHVTLSPWAIDGEAIRSRREVTPGYYLYNAEGV